MVIVRPTAVLQNDMMVKVAMTVVIESDIVMPGYHEATSISRRYPMRLDTHNVSSAAQADSWCWKGNNLP